MSFVKVGTNRKRNINAKYDKLYVVVDKNDRCWMAVYIGKHVQYNYDCFYRLIALKDKMEMNNHTKYYYIDDDFRFCQNVLNEICQKPATLDHFDFCIRYAFEYPFKGLDISAVKPWLLKNKMGNKCFERVKL